MTSTVPAIFAWPLIALMAVTLVARLKWCKANLYDTYFSNLMALVLVAQLLREQAVEDALSRGALMTVTTAQQLAFVAMVFASTELLGFTMLWTGLSPDETRRRHHRYRLAAVILSLAYLAAATPARVAGTTLELYGGWEAILAWSFYLTMIVVLSARVIWMFANELHKSTHSRELLLAAAGVLLGVVSTAGCLEALILALTDQLGWTDTLRFRLWFHGFEFFGIAVAVFVLGAVPVVNKLICHLGLDQTSRTWNKLEPLRASMTAAVPECCFNIAERTAGRYQRTTLQLHQSIIEILDAMLQLRPYSRPLSVAAQVEFLERCMVPTRERDDAIRAYELARAARAKASGAAPQPAVQTPPRRRTRSSTLTGEADQLVRLAKWWPQAYAATQRLTPTDPRS